MRVLHIIRSLGVGGLEQMVADLVAGLMARNVDCAIACLEEPGERLQQLRDRPGCSDLPIWVGGDSRAFSMVWRLAAFVRQLRPDLIHTHNPRPFTYGAMASVVSSVPLVHTKHGRNYTENRQWVRRSRLLSRWARRIAAVSRDAADVALNTEMVSPDKLRVIPNGVDVRRFSPVASSTRSGLRGKMGLAADAFVIGSVGRLSQEKNYGMLIEAFAGLVKEHRLSVAGEKEPVLVIVGDGPESSSLRFQVSSLSLHDSVMMPGMQSNAAEWLQCMDVFCLSSLTEGMSITLLEAAACGVPAAVTDVGGNGEVVEQERTGLVVPTRDCGALAAALSRLASDPVARVSMGVAARERAVQLYSVDRMVEAYIELYREVVVG